MEFRNPVYNSIGTVDVEINHPVYGWIPFTASPDDPNGKDIYDAAIAAGGVAAYVSPEPNSYQVDAERDRRIFENFKFNTISYQLDNDSQAKITSMGADARFATLGGAVSGNLRWADPNNDFGWIATDNSITPMDAQTMAAFADAAKMWVSRHVFAARIIKNMNPIPLDYATNEAYWPQP